MHERDRRRLELYREAQAQLMAMPTSNIKGRLKHLLNFRNAWVELESKAFQEYITAAIAVAQGDSIPQKPGDGPEYDPVSHMPMDTLWYIGNQIGEEGNQFRAFIQELTPEKVVELEQWSSVIEGMSDDLKIVLNLIGWRLSTAVEMGHTRRSVMRDIGKLLANRVFAEPDTEK